MSNLTKNGSGPARQAPLAHDANILNELGEKIFLDRYAVKDMTRSTLAEGDTVVVMVNANTNQREIGKISQLNANQAVVELRDGTVMTVAIEHVDKPLETHPAQMMERVARGVASIEKTADLRQTWTQKFRSALDGFKFVPAGRILTAAGSDQNLTFYNCYVVPSPKDSRQGIMSTLTQMTEIMSRGGGVGINLSSLRPAHSYVKGVNGRSSGSVSWGALYSFVTGLIEQGGSRRGALMLILDDWHPDIFNFINSKRTAGKITNANISVGVSDALMAAVKADGDWDLVFPDTTYPDYNETWDGNLEGWRAAGKPIIKHKTVKAREVWNAIIESAWSSAEPGVFFNDRYNKMSNSWYFAPIICTNPCGEQGLPGWGVCNLGAVNLAKFYDANKCDVAWRDLGETVRIAVRFLDNVIDATPYFFDENYAQQQKERRVGLNTMGLAELMLRLGIRYGSAESVRWLDRLYEFIATESYEASIELAQERGAFPAFDADKHLQSGFMKSLPQRICEKVAKHGIRNVTLLTQAPNGTIGTMVDTSTGIEPFFSWTFYRKSRLGLHEQNVAVVEEWKRDNPGRELPNYFVTAMELSPEEHVRVQAAIQRWVDSSISKTCNVPNEYTVEQVRKLYEQMYDLGCKGGTIYRDGSRDEQVLMLKADEKKAEAAPVVEVAEPQPAIAPLPMLRQGVTVSKHTAMGTLHLTSTHDENGEPFEVFMTVGKAGSDLQADGEALGRLISLLLRVASPLSRRERLEMVISQLEGIGGARTVGFGANRVSSMPDALASALRQIYFGENGVQQLALPAMGFPAPPVNGSKTNGHAKNGQNGHAKNGAYSTTEINGEVVVKISGADMCPSCGMVTLVRSEGCKKCQSCGYSEC
ncbi:MAG: adenosylcobalamin-dependent ribonucleoside-diphosphate reductase [Anaerolineae bacterium]|nr:adenosylcobalamin-dependent ribonucleoside-diphosphate reductase [Anaerolineae bacterium]